MNPAQLLSHFNRISEAPDAIPRLRQFILDLAVRGKLVKQDPKDEPASELLRRIQAERARLLEAGEIREERILPPGNPNEMLFELPAGWEWTRIRQVTTDRGQTIPNEDFTYIDVTAIDKEAGCIADAKIIKPSNAPSRARKRVKKGDVLYSCVRPYLLNIAIVEKEIVPLPIASTAFAILYGFGLVLSKYLWIALRSPFMVECVEMKMRGQAYPAINDSDFALLPLPLPPAAEQRRIIAKVDELMALCDQLETAQAEREDRRNRLVASSLQRLNQPADSSEFREHARFHMRHLPRLTTRPEHIQQLRQTILNLAVRGKLVRQDPNDEPASELLKRIKVEKARLIADGKIRKENHQSEIEPDEIPFALPKCWAWVRLGDVIHLVSGQHLQPAEYSDQQQSGPPYITGPADFGEKGLVITRYAIIRKAVAENGQILLTVKGAGVGKTAICDRMEVAISRQLMAMTAIGWSQQFLLLTTHRLANALKENMRSLIPGISREDVAQFAFPLPPIAEQHRIVAKVDELMTVCDQLKMQLTTAQAESRRLLEAVLHEALIPKS
jgi:type I restriction enzyme, S subunit